jgi:poly-gamma-glutamate capsule biosynthesis protein CapA/YwtB (metallophosphatase superfamily)
MFIYRDEYYNEQSDKRGIAEVDRQAPSRIHRDRRDDVHARVHAVLGPTRSVMTDHADRLLTGLRAVASGADLVMVNLESPLTDRAFVGGDGVDLRAPPAAAAALAAAGVDLVSIANNHAGDAGPATVLDTVSSARAVGLATVGGGADLASARAAHMFDLDGTVVGVLAYDATGVGPAAGDGSPGVAHWNRADAEADVASLRSQVDLVVVSVHGGTEYIPFPDLVMAGIAADLVSWNVDVVWGHGAHVVHPVGLLDPEGDGRPTLVATGLGNLLFDQSYPGTDTGIVVEAIASPDGVVGYRIGSVSASDGAFMSWEEPTGPAVWLDGWWEAPTTPPLPPAAPSIAGFDRGDVVAVGGGDVDGDGSDEVVVSFRRPHQPAELHDLLPGHDWVDASGRTAHIGVFEQDTMAPIWVAGALGWPVAEVAVCDGSMAVAHDHLDTSDIRSVAPWTWSGFGFDEGIDIEGARPIGCADLDGDGRSEPWIGEREAVDRP